MFLRRIARVGCTNTRCWGVTPSAARPAAPPPPWWKIQLDEISGGKRIFFWSADSSGCAYYRCELPAAELARHGHETHTASAMPDEWLHTADITLGQRVCQPGPTIR
jgi:hypothetical protein